MIIKNDLITKPEKDSISFKSILCIIISTLITSFIGCIFTKYLLKDFDNIQSLVNYTLIVVMLVRSLIETIIFIIEMFLFYYILKFFLKDIDFGCKITPKRFINISGCLFLSKGVSAFIFTLVTSYIYNYTALPFEVMIDKWIYNSCIINITSNIIFLIFMVIYYEKKILHNKKIKIAVAFFVPYVLITIIPIIPIALKLMWV